MRRKKIKRIQAFLLSLIMIISSISIPSMGVNAETIQDDYGTGFAVKVKNVGNEKYLSLGDAASSKVEDVVTFNADETGAEVLTMEYITEGQYKGQVNFSNSADIPLRLGEKWEIDGTPGIEGPGGFLYAVDAGIDGWESVIMKPLGNGTVAFKSSRTNDYFLSIDENNQFVVSDVTEVEELTDYHMFVIETDAIPMAVDADGITFTKVTNESLTISWDALPVDCVFTGYELYRSKSDTTGDFDEAEFGEGEEFVKICDETTVTSFEDTDLETGATYSYYVKTVNGNNPANNSNAKTVTTLDGVPPSGEITLSVAKEDGMKLTWNAGDNATKYDVFKAESKFASYEKIATDVADTTYTDESADTSKYSYYKIQPKNDLTYGEMSEPVSLETELFGENIIIFGEEDSRKDIDSTLDEIFKIQRNAEFSDYHYAAYFKPGNYEDIKTIQVGYYTHIGGLGKTPYDVRISNVETPADERFKPGGYYGDYENWGKVNATCTFWRSAENFTVAGTSGQRGGDGVWERWDGEDFNWGVSQAAPLRRINAEKNLQLQWNYGQASGGFVADSLLATTPLQGSQQQYYQRNNKIINAKVYDKGNEVLEPSADAGWNAVYQGIDATFPESIASSNWDEIKLSYDWTGAPVYSGRENEQLYNQWSNVTHIDETPVMREKPFLYFDEDEDDYKVFVPSLRNDSVGISWSEGNMGLGSSISIDEFYVVKEGVDTSASINAALDNGKHLFFRVGGFLDENVHVDAAVEINSDHVIGDHFWVWRAEHGAGVGWYRNTSPNGLIVNGDDVTFYGLMVEHFQEYQVLWRGENGKTFFLQNETPYDAPVQEAYMSHNGTVNGYSIYKVANDVDNHYAVGLGMYDVFINNYADQTKTDGIEVGGDKSAITIANAIEVPNKPGVVIENACVVNISDEDREPHGIETIINGVAEGTAWLDIGQRMQIVSFSNGTATLAGNKVIENAEQFDDIPPVVKEDLETTYDKYKDVQNDGYDQDAWDYFELILGEAVKALADPDASQSKIDRTIRELDQAYAALVNVDMSELHSTYDAYKKTQDTGYTKASWDALQTQLEHAKNAIIKAGGLTQAEVDKIVTALKAAYNGLTKGDSGNPNPDDTVIKAASVSLDKTAVDRMFVGDNIKLTATVAPANTANKSVKFTSSNEAVASVSAAGEITAKAAGTANITVATTDGSNKTAVCKVTVYAKANKINITAVGIASNQKATKLYVAKNKSLTLKSEVATTGAMSGVSYTTANPKIAAVTAKGVIKGKKAGKTKITVTSADGFKKQVINVTVTAKQTKVKSIKVTSKKSLTMKAKATQQIKTKVSPASTTYLVTYKTSKKAVATVDSNGKITAKKKGKAKITVTCGGKKQVINVTVK